MQFTVEIQVDHLTRALEAVRLAIATPQEMLASIGESLKPANEARHAQGLAPDGTKWKAASPLTLGSAVWKSQGESFRKSGQMSLAAAGKVKGRRRLLYDNGDLLGSFNYQVQADELRLGFGDKKATWHHFGTGTFGPRGSPYVISAKKAKALSFAGLMRKRVTHPGIPARPLVGLPPSDQAIVADVVTDHLSLAMNQAR